MAPDHAVIRDHAVLEGRVHWRLLDADGWIKAEGDAHNMLTQYGDQVAGERAAGVSGAPAAPTGMKLGTGTTVVSKTGAGATLVAYLGNSHKALDATYPTSVLNGAARRITYQCTWGPGSATSASPITEAALVNNTIADAAPVANNTTARVILSPAVPGSSPPTP